jgi:hypothetical protein
MDIVGERRLLKLADILDLADETHRAKKQPTYNQMHIEHDCGTPACAIGHWIRHSRGRVYLTSNDVLLHKDAFGAEGVCLVGSVEFRITGEQAYELFGGRGCDEARTAKQAAKYIRRFVKRVKQLEGR